MSGKLATAFRFALAIALGSLPVAGARGQASFINYEIPPVHPLDLSPDGSKLAVLNQPAAQLEIHDLSRGIPLREYALPVGSDPTSARFRTDTEVWVVNHISDSISVVDLATKQSKTLRTLDEPFDVVFAGNPQRAYVSCAQVNTLQVFDPVTLLETGQVLIKGEEPRALAVSPDGSKVYAAIFESGNGSTLLAGGAGNGTIADPPNVVSDPLGPHGGVNPPPNGPGGTFVPPKRVGNPNPPRVGLIVKQDGQARWRDDTGADWTDFVSGPMANRSGRVQGWSLIDNDLATVDTATHSVSYATRMMNICMSVGVNPANGRAYVIGTDAINEVRFEPNVDSIFVRVKVGIASTTGTVSVVDLNPHLDYQVRRIPQEERDQSIGDPRGIAWTADGSRGYVTGMGSNNLIVIDEEGNRIQQAPLPLNEGPTGIIIDEARGRLYVFARFAGRIDVVRMSDLKTLAQVDVFNPTPNNIRVGRKHMYDTHKTSGLGQAACASCHVDGKMDRLAWDLGDPSGAVKPIVPIALGSPQTGGQPSAHNNLGGIGDLLGAGLDDFHPMKGPMTTQSFQDIIGNEPLHWRGDRDGLEEFNGAFIGLQGDDTNLTGPEMAEFKGFVASLYYTPNPHRNLDNTLPDVIDLSDVPASGRFALPEGAPLPPGRPYEGLSSYLSNGLDGRGQLGVGIDCVTCHTLPTGMGADLVGSNITFGINPSGGLRASAEFLPIAKGPRGESHLFMTSLDGSTNANIKVSQLRNQLEKMGFDLTKPENLAGFGILHDGSIDTISRFVSEPIFFPSGDQEVADLVAFMMSFGGSDLPVGGYSGYLDATFNLTITAINVHPRGPDGRDSHAATGYNFTVDTNRPIPTVMGENGLELLLREARESGAVGQRGIDLVATAELNGVERAWFYNRTTNRFISDTDSETGITSTTLINIAMTQAPITFKVAQRNSGRRLSIDKDGDGFGNVTETLACTDPENGASRPNLGAPELVIDRPAVDFGDQHIDEGPYFPADVSVINVGPGVLTFKGPRAVIVGPDADDFAITSGLPANPVNSNTIRPISVTFDPSTTGPKQATLLIVTSDCDNGIVEVALTGSGIDGEVPAASPTVTPSLTPSPSFSPTPSLTPTPTPFPPEILDLGDYIIGDLEDGANSNLFVYPDAIALNQKVQDQDTPSDEIIWSYVSPGNAIRLNGATPMGFLPPSASINPPAQNRITTNDLDPAKVDADPFTVTLRNTALSPVEGPNIEPGRSGVVTSQTQNVTIFASDGTGLATASMLVFTANNREDETLEAFDFTRDADFANDGPNSWWGGVFAGDGAITSGGGLCMDAPLEGNNIIGWVSPERSIDLVDLTAYRLRVRMSTNQAVTDQIPLWTVSYDNYNTSGNGSTYGGDAWFLDVGGGSQGIGRAQGRTEFTVMMGPNAMLTQQWRGVVDQATSAFTAEADAANDMRLSVRLLDIGDAPILANLDSGRVCLERMRVDSILAAALTTDAVLFNPPVSSATHVAQNNGELAEGAGAALIDDVAQAANYALLDGTGLGFRKTIFPYDTTLPEGSSENLRLYPAAWEANTIYKASVRVRSNVAGGAEGADPVDALFVAMDSVLSETGSMHYTTRGSFNNMLRAASPRLAATTGGQAQTYVMFFHSNNAGIDTAVPDSHRLRPIAYFYNTPQIGPEGLGADPFTVEALTLERVNTPVR